MDGLYYRGGLTFKWVYFWLETDILGNAFLGALTLPCYGHIPPRQRPHLRTHSKSVPLSLTRPHALGKLLLFSDLGTYTYLIKSQATI